MFTTLAALISAPATPEVSRPATEDVPSDWESKGVKSGVCVIA
jgi:hypothetical protein